MEGAVVKKTNPLPPLDILRSLFELSNASPSGLIHATASKRNAGSKQIKGYFKVTIEGKAYGAHRIVWSLHNESLAPVEMLVDHIDGNPSNNDPGNLRLLTHRDNTYNQTKINRRNKSGLPGVFMESGSTKWTASICIDGNKCKLGRYPTKELAFAAYVNAKKSFHPTFDANRIIKES